MVGIVIVGHCNLAQEFYKIAEMIVGSVKNIYPVDIDPHESPDDSIDKVSKAIKKVNEGDGVLVLTDMFGGTPSNLSLSFLEGGKVEVLTGVNLPMLIRLITLRDSDKKELMELARELKAYGKKNIFIASEILNQQKAVES
jgi:PTS system mannose-specific IIA component